jgi:hypothetical protein
VHGAERENGLFIFVKDVFSKNVAAKFKEAGFVVILDGADNVGITELEFLVKEFGLKVLPVLVSELVGKAWHMRNNSIG